MLDRGGVLRHDLALEAGCVAAHVRLELVDRVAVMHRVARHARHRALGVAGAHPHGGELEAAGKDATIKIYNGAGHAFLADYRDSYNEKRAHELWVDMLAFLGEKLS